MSTQLADIQGSSQHSDNRLYVNQFFGGTDRGICIQLTSTNGKGYTQLDRVGVEKLQETLEKWLTPKLPFINSAIAAAQKALAGDSNDAEHDALVALVSALGSAVPNPDDCTCDNYSWHGEGHASACPLSAF